MEEAITTLLKSQTALQNALKELCDLSANREPHERQPRHGLAKMTADDYVEAFLEVFERTARREGWAPGEWAHILAPLLTGEAQHTMI